MAPLTKAQGNIAISERQGVAWQNIKLQRSKINLPILIFLN